MLSYNNNKRSISCTDIIHTAIATTRDFMTGTGLVFDILGILVMLAIGTIIRVGRATIGGNHGTL